MISLIFYRHESRDIIRNAVNASEHDAVIFSGHGCTGAIHKLINGLDLGTNPDLVVLVSQQEHHSNLLPWRQVNAQVVFIKETEQGQVDLEDLKEQLELWQKPDRLLVGCFPAASNISGILNDDLKITALLHSHGALSFWDYATAAPYVDINMNPKIPEDLNNLCAKDAIYFSMHKFVGGVQTPGILVAKKELFKNEAPAFGGGGGSVFFVTESDHKYLKEIELREESGTPAIVESIRSGLVMKLKTTVQADQILKREHALLQKAKSKLQQNENFVLLGNAFNNPEDHLPILSFMIKDDHGLFLHHNFVCSLLNDLFGIQARGGCACAGPYAQHLMGMTQDLAKQYEQLLLEDERLDRVHLRRGHRECSQYEFLRPGFSRLNLPWFSNDEEIDFILEALDFVAKHAWKFMPQYIFNNETGEWKHHTNQVFKERKWLGNFDFLGGTSKNVVIPLNDTFEDILKKAFEKLDETTKVASKLHIPDQTLLFSDAKVAKLKWILLPSEAKSRLCSRQELVKINPPFHPKHFKTSLEASSFGSYDGNLSEKSLNFSLNGHHKSSWLNFKITKKELTNGHHSEPIQKPDPEPDQDYSIDACILTKRPEMIPSLQIKAKWRPPTKDIFKPFLEAIETFEMIKPGDRVLVCLSGGKDSLTLLHTMKQYQYYTKMSFELGAMTIDPLSSAYDPRPLIPYLKELNVHYLYEEQDIMRAAKEANPDSICAFCSRMKRGRMYAAARRENYNVLALGQHLDDLAESFLMSIFHNGRLRTMKANYRVQEGDLRIVRPFVYVREKQLRTFAETQKLPVIPENCPACFENPKERHRTKQLLAQQELLFPKLYWSLKSALHPVMNIRATGIESSVFGKQGKVNGNYVDDELD